MSAFAVMLLAAGRGARLRPLTDKTPKPLIPINGERLIERHLRSLANVCEQVVINVSYKGKLIRDYLGDGRRYGLHILYSDEGNWPLETAGGIRHALPLLDGDTVLVVNSDVYTDWQAESKTVPADCLAHLLLVDNPSDHPQGDFFLDHGRLTQSRGKRLTFAGMAYYRREFFNEVPDSRYKLSTALRQAALAGKVSAERYEGLWINVSDAEKLAQARRHSQSSDVQEGKHNPHGRSD